jgi:hypothetical protein
MRCEECGYYMKFFSLCLSGNPVTVDPEQGCVATPITGFERSPCKQLTPHQNSLLKDTDLKMKWDGDGWLTEVSVRGLPQAPALHEIPHSPVTFAYYDQLCTGNLRYCRNPSHPGVLIFRDILNEMSYQVYKEWHAELFPEGSNSRRIPAHAVPEHLANISFIGRLSAHRVKNYLKTGHGAPVRIGEFVQFEADVDKTIQLWQSHGYQAGYVRVERLERDIPYFAYQFQNTEFVAFIGRLPANMRIDDFVSRVTVQPTNDTELLEKLKLSNRCIACGYPNEGPFEITYPCHFCQNRVSTLVFKPKQKGTKD